MQINRALLESSDDIARHFMTDRERKTKKALCQLLIKKGHRKYAERFWKFDFNIVDSKKHPDFTAAISFDEATVFISDGFLGTSEGIFNQLDVLLRHELAHNLMMHQIRLMHVFKRLHKNDPEEAYEHISYSESLHNLLNIIEDFEISNKRYTTADKKIVKTMTLNGKVIGGLITEEHRANWANMPLEAMYDELSKELIAINSAIRSNPDWLPTKNGRSGDTVDPIKYKSAEIIASYTNIMRPSGIRSPLAVFIKSKTFSKFENIYKKLVTALYEAFKDFGTNTEKQSLLDIVKNIAITDPQETFDVINPKTGEVVITLYTPEEKALTNDVLKNLGGNINYDPLKFKVKKQTNSEEYKDAWNKVITTLDKKQFDDDTLNQVLAALNNI